jgi:DNA-binding YbaB/EbfC family protein
LMRQANQMQSKMKKLQEELATREFDATSGGGAVKAIVTGDNKVKSITIQPDVISSGDQEMLQDLVVTAINEALKVAKTSCDGEMAKVTGGFSMPGMF